MTSPADAIGEFPARGKWAVGVSGGADSVALLLLLLRSPLASSLHIAHLDHETRCGASAQDAAFVRDLASRLNADCTIATRSAVEAGIDLRERNLSARYREARLALFRQVVSTRSLDGVMLAHHADDQAETVLHRILRGGTEVAGLAGMARESRVGGLLIVRPLLNVPSCELRALLESRGQSWREDESNKSDAYLRNRLRRVLSSRPGLTGALLRLSASCRQARTWLYEHSEHPPAVLETRTLLALALPKQRELARRWLRGAGVPRSRIDPDVIARFITMAQDAAGPARIHFPGKVLVRRRQGKFIAAIP